MLNDSIRVFLTVVEKKSFSKAAKAAVFNSAGRKLPDSDVGGILRVRVCLTA